MFCEVEVEDFHKTKGDITLENELRLRTITDVLQEFEDFENNIRKEGDDNGNEFISNDFIKFVIDKNYPETFFKVRHLYKGKEDDILNKFVTEIDEEDLFSIPSFFGKLKLLFYQELSIYLSIFGKKSTENGIELSLKIDEIPWTTRNDRKFWNKIEPISETRMFPSNSNHRGDPFVLNLPTGTGKSITSILTATIAMCDTAFQIEMLKPKNLTNWFKDYQNYIPGSNVTVEMTNFDSLDIKILPVTMIHIKSGSLFSQWHSIISSHLNDIAKYCQEFIFRRTGNKRGVKVSLYPAKVNGNLNIKLKSLSNLWYTNQDESNIFEIAFVITTDSNFVSFAESDNELFVTKKKRKVNFESSQIESKRVIYTATCVINDEPQTSNLRHRFSKVLTPLDIYLCATVPQVLTENSGCGLMLRKNSVLRKSTNLIDQIIAERGEILFFDKF